MNKICLIIGICILLKPTYSYAYLDPGTGGSFLQIIIAFFAAVGASIGLYWQRFKALLKRIFSKKRDNKE